MNNKKIFFIVMIFLISSISALTQPNLFYPNSVGITIDNGTEINWSSSTDEDIVKYNLFYSNDSGTNWHDIILNWGYINYLNDSNTEENISFSGNENQTVYIDIPKYANVTSAKLNLSGYPAISSLEYNSTADESESDGDVDQASTGFSLGYREDDDYIELYLLVNTPPDANILAIEHLTLRTGTPENLNIIYNVKIAETDGYLSGDPSDDNTTPYTTVKSNFNVSTWGSDATWGTQRSIIFDTLYTMDSSKKYIIWYEFVSGDIGSGSNVYSLIEETNPINNFLGWVEGADEKYSFGTLIDTRLYSDASFNIGVGNTSNVWLEVGEEDGNYEWNQTGNFTTINVTEDFNSTLQSYIDNNCTVELWENCTIPLTLHSDTIGIIKLSAIDIQFTDYWWNTTNLNELTTYLINITPTNSSANGTSVISSNDFIIAHNNPNVTLNSPNISYSNSTSDPVNVDFNCSATDDFGLKNISIYITNNQNLSFSLNQTTIVSGNNSANWTLSLSNGIYTWNCLAYDNGNNLDWGENRSITINYVASVTPSPSGGGSSGGSSISKKEKIDFDVKIIRADSPLELKQFFNFTYFIKGVGEINNDVLIEFWLEKNNIKITSGSDIIYFGNSEEKTETTQLFLHSKTLNDTYDFYVQASYKNYSAKAHRSLEVIYPEKEFEEEKSQEFHSEKFSFWKSILNKIKSGFLFVFQHLKNNKIYLIFGLGSLILLAILILIILFIIKKFKKETKPNRLKSTIKLKVYSADGNHIGKIKDVYLKKNKISGWLININRKVRKKIRKKQILIKHKDVESISEIMIVDKRIEDFLNK